ncbi:ABC transporter ATP-binding protein [Microlunatus panaciterrae]|uniref:ABC-type Fe3+/spermidine/putrescine transport system ATPase subunit n=1 Tax=Microlunatus panaciterrae TaxID=400768 RepID=A0ABS2RMJ3_9ACTN|nr:ABC transporter ATP-binding protein [Microlunatus panaciterrae]MBM7799943.1 ABC-type Fe3+/spermidine/putrescine transport system ATPase subunit [Microlunatus panaciterrae]
MSVDKDIMTATAAPAVASGTAQHPGSAGLQLKGITKVLGGRTIVDDLDLTVHRGELVCLLGPSGCGKTTTLRMIAGFLTPDAGSVQIDDQDVTRLRPEKRPTAMVFQNYALWPHMSVFDNVAFGLKLRKLPKAEIVERVQEMLELVNLTHHIRSRPARISGGEQQRVALARALVQRPAVLLLDEPLSNLDAKLRVRVREDIREIQQRLAITTVVVTHDQDEALSISDRVAVMNGGRIEQYSSPIDLYRRPSTKFVGSFVGAMNAFPGTVRHTDGTLVAVLEGRVEVPVDPGDSAPGTSSSTGSEVGVRPEDVTVAENGAGAPGTVSRVIPRGHFTEMVVVLSESGSDQPLTVRAYLDNGDPLSVLQDGAQVRVRFRSVLLYADEVLT